MVVPPRPVGLSTILFSGINASVMTVVVDNHDSKILGADAHCELMDQTGKKIWTPAIKPGKSASYNFPPGHVPLPPSGATLQLQNVTLVVINEDIVTKSDNSISWTAKCPDGSIAGEDFCSEGAAFTRTLIDLAQKSVSSHWVTGGCKFTPSSTNATAVCANSGSAPSGMPADCGSIPPLLFCSDCAGLCGVAV